MVIPLTLKLNGLYIFLTCFSYVSVSQQISPLLPSKQKSLNTLLLFISFPKKELNRMIGAINWTLTVNFPVTNWSAQSPRGSRSRREQVSVLKFPKNIINRGGKKVSSEMTSTPSQCQTDKIFLAKFLLKVCRWPARGAHKLGQSNNSWYF